MSKESLKVFKAKIDKQLTEIIASEKAKELYPDGWRYVRGEVLSTFKGPGYPGR